MQYITGMQALNIPCSLNTFGDWHRSCMDWHHLSLKESEGSLWGDYGIEGPKLVPGNDEKYYVANHIRALLDLLYERKFADAQGMKNDFIGDDQYDEEIFQQVLKMKNLPYWAEIDAFMEKEYLLQWARYKENHHLKALSCKLKLIKSQEQKNKGSALMAVTVNNKKSDYSEFENILLDFLHKLNRESNAFVLKGNSALRFCYGLDRESIGLEFDSATEDVLPYAERYCKEHRLPYGFGYPDRIYPSEMNSLAENGMICSGTRNVPERDTCFLNGIRVYKIDRIASMKLVACTDLPGILDLYDFVYICKNYGDEIPHALTLAWGDFMAFRGMDFLKFHINYQRNLPIDLYKLKEDVLQLADRFGIQLDSDDF